MNVLILSVLSVAAAYLIGAIPFGFLVARGLRGIDIRTVGSGNIGATNVGRVLGFRYFLLVFTFDLLKGLGPTLGFPLLVAQIIGRPAPPELPVLTGLAAILGHNFPVYLGFKGGKGVATSLGVVLGLDPVAGGASAVGFLVALLVTGYVSISSMLGGGVFFLAHFSRVESPWSREQLAMSLVTIALLILLVARHRKNIARIAAGTEPKVRLRKPREASPSGRIAVVGLLVLTVLVGAGVAGQFLWRRANERPTLTIGRTTLREVARVGTGHQRAERVAFADRGRLLVVTCPRYERVVYYRVTDEGTLEESRELNLEGMPKAVCPAADRIYVLQRPAGDRRHVEPGWWEAFDFQGERLGERVPVGYYPDDMVLLDDQRHVAVLCSGRAEGDETKPLPALDLYDLDHPRAPIGQLTFDEPKDDPARLTLSRSGRYLGVTLWGSDVVAGVEITDLTAPRSLGRTRLADVRPYVSHGESDDLVMPVASAREALRIETPGLGDCLMATLPHGSAIEFYRPIAGQPGNLGVLQLHGGALGLSQIRPTGLAFCAERRLIAVANRSGGVHLVRIEPGREAVAVRDRR